MSKIPKMMILYILMNLANNQKLDIDIMQWKKASIKY